MPKGAMKADRKPHVARKEMTVSVSERKSTFSVVCPGLWTCRKTHVDYAPFVESLSSRCDYAIELQTGADERKVFFFVELKGEDVCRAAEQLAYAIQNRKAYMRVLEWRTYPCRYACIVSTRGHKPRILTRFQRFKASMRKEGFVVHEKVRAMNGVVLENGGFLLKD